MCVPGHVLPSARGGVTMARHFLADLPVGYEVSTQLVILQQSAVVASSYQPAMSCVFHGQKVMHEIV